MSRGDHLGSGQLASADHLVKAQRGQGGQKQKQAPVLGAEASRLQAQFPHVGSIGCRRTCPCRPFFITSTGQFGKSLSLEHLAHRHGTARGSVLLERLADVVNGLVLLARYGGGGTNCSIPLHEANTTYRKRKFAGCVLVSDNESWVGRGRHGSTGVMSEWQTFVKNQMQLGGHETAAPKLVCIDIQPYGSSQAPERADILNIGGFSDAVFNVVASYLSGDASRFVAEIDAIEL